MRSLMSIAVYIDNKVKKKKLFVNKPVRAAVWCSHCFRLKVVCAFPTNSSSLMLAWMRRKLRERTCKHTHIAMHDDSLMTSLPPITPTVKLLHRLRHLVCSSYRFLWWVCLPGIFLSHFELFITHLILYLYWIPLFPVTTPLSQKLLSDHFR